MSNHISLMIKVFRVELEEAENDIQALMDYYSNRFDNLEITPYVWRENRALLIKEVSCIKELESDLDGWVPPDEDDIQIALTALKEYLKNQVVKHGYPKLVNVVLDRISNKVTRYID
ncbi:MAG: hypothetical protein KAH21_09205 [Spirochaetaceae bacterium]|nr:hypothetical protein [Spirochaetaceae bacterium]